MYVPHYTFRDNHNIDMYIDNKATNVTSSTKKDLTAEQIA